MTERLQKVLARSGIASRRKAEELIRDGHVAVNGAVVTEMGTRVDADQDRIQVDGETLRLEPPPVYYMLNKPPGYISTARDDRGRRTVLDLVQVPERVYPVGRLDLESEGLVLLTNDGELTNLLTHPRYEHEKEYHVWVDGQPTDEALQRLRDGIELDDGVARADEIELIESGRRSHLRLVLHEGRKHIVRRMCEAIGHPVVRLVRVRMGPLRLGDLALGDYRPLTKNEVERLKSRDRKTTRTRTTSP